jgi:glycosyltransferase involved in cell wall biosynthesis
MKITLIFMTGRADPKLEWVLGVLARDMDATDEIDLIVVDALDRTLVEILGAAPLPSFPGYVSIFVTPPKPNVWQGKHRVTSCDWWATANARNTAIVLAHHDYLVFIDDRGVPGPSWLSTIREGERERSGVLAGAYEKRETRGAITILTRDHRHEIKPSGLANCGGGWLYGCTFALPLAWALEVNGLEEGCDGLTGEDYIFGLMLGNAGHRIDFVPSLFVSQDRTVGNETCKGAYACRDKGASPRDKSHAALDRFGVRKRTEFTPDLTELRARRERGDPWPIPNPAIDYRDWYDQELIRNMLTA